MHDSKRAKGSMTKERNKKKWEGGKQNKITDSSITSVADVSQRENYCIKRRNWSAIQKCYHSNTKLKDELLKKKCMVLLLRM